MPPIPPCPANRPCPTMPPIPPCPSCPSCPSCPTPPIIPPCPVIPTCPQCPALPSYANPQPIKISETERVNIYYGHAKYGDQVSLVCPDKSKPKTILNAQVCKYGAPGTGCIDVTKSVSTQNAPFIVNNSTTGITTFPFTGGPNNNDTYLTYMYRC